MFLCSLLFCPLKMNQDSNGFLDINVLQISLHMDLQISNPLPSESHSWVSHFQQFALIKDHKIGPLKIKKKANNYPNDLQLSII